MDENEIEIIKSRIIRNRQLCPEEYFRFPYFRRCGKLRGHKGNCDFTRNIDLLGDEIIEKEK